MKKLFSILTIILAIALQVNAQTSIEKHWVCNSHQYPNNMTVVGIIKLDGEELLTETMEIGAFYGEECRGSEILRYYPNVDRYLAFLTVYGTINDEIIFRLYDHATEVEVIADAAMVVFDDNDIIGNPGEPYVFDFNTEVTYYSIQANSLPQTGGMVMGVGEYQYGRVCSLIANAEYEYQFNYWLKDNVIVSTDPSLSFIVTENAAYSACFKEQNTYSQHWYPNTHQYENNMTMIGLIQVDGEEINSEAYEIGAFCGNECRGSAFLQYQPLYDKYLVYMTVNGQEGEKIKFRLYNHQWEEQVDRITASVRFVSNAHYGTPENPYIYYFTTYLTINTNCSPVVNCGYVTGGGQFLPDDSCTLVAVPYPDYVFMYWTENEQIVSTDAEYSFEVTRSMNLVANFSAYLPELHVTSISHSEFMGGQTASISWTVQNDGIMSTPVGAVWYDRVYLSLEDKIRSGGDWTLLGEFQNIAALEPGEYYTQTQSFTLPLRMSGPYYLFVITDSQYAYDIEWLNDNIELPYTTPPYIGAKGYPNRIFEMSEFVKGKGQQNTYYHDNFYYDQVNIAVPPLPDLQVTNILAPTDFLSGTAISVTATITNMGDERTQVSSWTDRLFVSDTSVFIPSRCTYLDSRYHNGYLYPDSTYQQIFHGAVPVTMYGNAYFYVYTDYYEQNYEHIMSNNNMSCSDPINIILTPPADLVPYINNYPESVSTGTLLPISFTVQNQGAGLPNYYSWYDGVYLSNNANGLDDNAISLGEYSHYGKLNPNQTYIVNKSISIPSSVPNGTYYLYIVTDCYNDVFEYLYDDNNIVQGGTQITITKPDLQIEDIIVPDTLTVGYPFTISYVLKNDGDGVIENWNIQDKIGVSPNESLSYQRNIAYVNNNGLNLQSGQSKNINYSGSIPGNIPEGTYYLYLRADAYNNLNESNEYNNHTVKYPVFISHRPLPDLKPISLNIPNGINAGTNVEIAFDIANIGDIDLLDANCRINLYAEKYNNNYQYNSKICSMISQTQPIGGPNITIMAGDTVHFVRTYSIPPSVNSTYNAFRLVVNDYSWYCYVDEIDQSNNTLIINNVVFHDCPLPDLTVSSIEVPPTIQSGSTNQVAFYVKNIGNLDLQNAMLDYAVQCVVGNGIDCPIETIIEPQPNANISIPVGDSIHVVINILVPPMIDGAQNTMSFSVNPNGTIVESNESNNSKLESVDVLHYPFDLEMVSMTVPSELLGGRTYEISWTVKNIGSCPSSEIPMYIKHEGECTVVAGDVLPTPWIDKIYFSNDNVFSNDDVELTSVGRSTVLNPNGTYTVTHTFVAPYAEGTKYIICNTDATQVTYDYNRNNNVTSHAVSLDYGTLPDLRITDVSVSDVITSGYPCWVHYTVTNEGENATLVDAWTDAFYVGRFANNVNNAATIVGSKIHNGILDVGESYTDSVQVTPANGLEGNYYFIGFTDATFLVFEKDNENDNMMSAPVCLVKPLPCDLQVLGINFPEEAETGEDFTVTWQVANFGSHAASGNIRDAVYLSADDVWSSDDVMLGYMETEMTIPSFESVSRELTAKVQGVTEGNYYVIVKTNIMYALNETSYDNNDAASLSLLSVDYPILDIGRSVERSLEPDQNIYYRIVVGPEYEGQTLSCQLNTNSILCMNKLYIAYENVPTLARFDLGASTPMKQELEILIPVLRQGSYYVLATGTNSESLPQSITLATSIVNFEILHVDTDHGSNTGSITTQIIGAKFDTIMDFRLVNGNEYLPAEKVFFTNSTETYATFNLIDMPTGSYGMEAELPGGIITIKDQAFQIEEGLPAELVVNIIAPSSVRAGNKFSCTIEYGNYGSTDLNVSGFVVTSNYPIAFTSAELVLNQFEITFMTAEGHGNPDVLRPGYFNTKTVFVDAKATGNVQVHVYAIRRHY